MKCLKLGSVLFLKNFVPYVEMFAWKLNNVLSVHVHVFTTSVTFPYITWPASISPPTPRMSFGAFFFLRPPFSFPSHFPSSLPLRLCYFHMSDVLHVCLSQTKMNAARTTAAASTSASTRWARTSVSVATALCCMRTNMTVKKVGSTCSRAFTHRTHHTGVRMAGMHVHVDNTFGHENGKFQT